MREGALHSSLLLMQRAPAPWRKKSGNRSGDLGRPSLSSGRQPVVDTVLRTPTTGYRHRLAPFVPRLLRAAGKSPSGAGNLQSA